MVSSLETTSSGSVAPIGKNTAPQNGSQEAPAEEPSGAALESAAAAAAADAGGADAGAGGAAHSNPTSLLLGLACTVILILGMRYAAAVINPVLVALFVVMGLSPVLDWLRHRGVPAWLTITMVLIGFLAIAGAFVAVLVSYVGQLDARLTVYQANLSRMFSSIDVWLTGHGVDSSNFLSDVITPGRVTGAVSTMLGSILDALNNVLLMVMIVVFMMSQVYTFPRRMYSRFQLSKRFEKSFIQFGEVTRSYLFTKGWLAAISAAISTGVYYAFGVDFALLWGLVFFVLSFVPNFGFVISVIPPFVVTLLEAGFTRALLVLVVIVVLNTIVDNMIAPRFMGRSVGLSTLAVLLSLVFWAWVLGPVGALISIPLTLMVKLLFFDSYDSTRSISLFLTGGAETPPTRKKKRRGASAG